MTNNRRQGSPFFSRANVNPSRWFLMHELRYLCLCLSGALWHRTLFLSRFSFVLVDSPSAESHVAVRKSSSYRNALRYYVRACVSASLRPYVYVSTSHAV
ncbi:hypothetical protein V8C40DRAFT_239806 [Trichoderma camerunense]